MSDKRKYVKKPKVAKVKVPHSEAAQRPIVETGTGFNTVGELNVIADRREAQRRSASSPGSAGRQDTDRRGVAKVTTPKQLSITDIEVGAKAPKSNAPKPAGLSIGQRKKANQAARVAIRTNDPKAAKKALAGLPKGTKKTKKYAPKLEGVIKAAVAPKPSASPKLQAKAPAAPKITAPDAAKAAVHKVAPVQVDAPAAKAPKTDTRSVAAQLEEVRVENEKPDPKLKAKLARARKTNEKLNAEVATIETPEAPRADTKHADTTRAASGIKSVAPPAAAEPTADQKKASASKKFHRAKNAGFKKRQAESIAAKGVQTIPIRDTAAEMAETPEAATVRTRKLESDLLNAQAQESVSKTAPKPTAGEGDTRASTEMFGRDAVKEATQKIAEAPRTDLTLTAAPKGTARYGVNLPAEDSVARAAKADEIRAASSKVRNVAISRSATPEILESLDRATESEHSRALDSYFDEVEAEKRPMNQAGPRKGDAPRRILTPTIDANAELTVARTSAQPPAPSDRTTIQDKIDLINERGKPGGAAIYKGPESIAALENLRDHGEASTGAEPRVARVLPPGKDLAAEHFGPGRPSIRAARKEGQRAGRGQRPAGIPDMTVPGVVPAGPTTPPVTPAKLHARVDAPLKSQAQMWTKRMTDWGRGAYESATKKVSGPAVELAGETAKAQGRQVVGAKTKAMLGRGGVVGAGLLTMLVGAETAKAAIDAPAGQKLKAAKETATHAGASTAGTVAAIGLGVKGLSKVKPVLGKVASGALTVAAVPLIAKEGFDIGSLAGKEVAQVKEAKRKSARDKKYADQFYGTVEKATKTRHAKEAWKRIQAKKEKK